MVTRFSSRRFSLTVDVVVERVFDIEACIQLAIKKVTRKETVTATSNGGEIGGWLDRARAHTRGEEIPPSITLVTPMMFTPSEDAIVFAFA